MVEAAEEVTGAFIAIGEEAGSTDTGEATLRIGAFKICRIDYELCFRSSCKCYPYWLVLFDLNNWLIHDLLWGHTGITADRRGVFELSLSLQAVEYLTVGGCLLMFLVGTTHGEYCAIYTPEAHGKLIHTNPKRKSAIDPIHGLQP